MHIKSLLILLFSVSLGFASNIEDIVAKAYEKNYTLQGLEKAINSANENIAISRKWQNPILTFGANDIQFKDVDRRDIEAMQAEYIGITQVIPMGDKLELKEEVAKKDKQITQYILEDKKRELRSKIYELSYTIVIFEKKLKLFDTYLENINKLEALNVALYENNQALQTQALNAQVLHSKISLQRIKLANMIENLYLKLEEITQEKTDKIDVNLVMNDEKPIMNYENHPKLQIQKLKASKALDVAKFEAENKIPDVKFNVAYFQRDDKFQDYVNFSIGIPLSIYGTENRKVLVAKSKNYEELSRYEDLKKSFKTQTEILTNELHTNYKTYMILEQTIIPTKQKVQEALEVYNSLDKVKPQETIANLNELITFELNALDELQNYFQAYSQTLYYKDELK